MKPMAMSNRKGKEKVKGTEEKYHATFSRTLSMEVELPVPSGRYFLVAEQESAQRSRLKGQGRAPARHAFPLRIPQPLVLQIFRNVSVQRGAQLADLFTRLRVMRGTEGMSAYEEPPVLPGGFLFHLFCKKYTLADPFPFSFRLFYWSACFKIVHVLPIFEICLQISHSR